MSTEQQQNHSKPRKRRRKKKARSQKIVPLQPQTPLLAKPTIKHDCIGTPTLRLSHVIITHPQVCEIVFDSKRELTNHLSSKKHSAVVLFSPYLFSLTNSGMG